MEIMNIEVNNDELQTLLNGFACANTKSGIGEYSGSPYLNEKTISKLMKSNDFEIIFEKTKTENYIIIHTIDGKQTSKSELNHSAMTKVICHLFGNNTIPNNNIQEVVCSMQYGSTLYILFENMFGSWTIRVAINS